MTSRRSIVLLAVSGAAWAASARQVTVAPPLAGEKWWGGVLHLGGEMPYGSTARPVDLSVTDGVRRRSRPSPSSRRTRRSSTSPS